MHVPYKGGAQALLALLGGDIHMYPGLLLSASAAMKTGKARALAALSLKRIPAMPELPTIAESGVEGYEANNWWAVAAPAGTPPGVIAKLAAEMAQYLKLPETLKRFQAEGVEADIRAPAEVHKMVPIEIAKWKNVARLANVRVE